MKIRVFFCVDDPKFHKIHQEYWYRSVRSHFYVVLVLYTVQYSYSPAEKPLQHLVLLASTLYLPF